LPNPWAIRVIRDFLGLLACVLSDLTEPIGGSKKDFRKKLDFF